MSRGLVTLLFGLILLVVGLSIAAGRLSRVASEKRVQFGCAGSIDLPFRNPSDGTVLLLHTRWEGPFRLGESLDGQQTNAVEINYNGVTRKAWLYIVVADEEPEVVMAH